jgi:alkylation response protein AidB-like acyl-CoA dehydrogenase
MDFELPEEHRALQAMVRQLAEDKVKPRARQMDVDGTYPEDLFKVFRNADLLGLHGFQVMCEGGGMANATLVENLQEGVR